MALKAKNGESVTKMAATKWRRNEMKNNETNGAWHGMAKIWRRRNGES
jgi:hypothetical protein